MNTGRYLPAEALQNIFWKDFAWYLQNSLFSPTLLPLCHGERAGVVEPMAHKADWIFFILEEVGVSHALDEYTVQIITPETVTQRFHLWTESMYPQMNMEDMVSWVCENLNYCYLCVCIAFFQNCKIIFYPNRQWWICLIRLALDLHLTNLYILYIDNRQVNKVAASTGGT